MGILEKIQQKQMADRIKHRRESLGFTQESFSETICLSVSSYTKIENAFQKPSLDTLIEIALQLDLTLDYIVFGNETQKITTNSDKIVALLKSTDTEKLLHASKFLSQVVRSLSTETQETN